MRYAFAASIPAASAQRATLWQLSWLCAAIIGFSYELPLVRLTSYDRVNPRLFDIVSIVGLFMVLPTVSIPAKLSPVFRIWAIMVAWFVFIATIWTVLWIPFVHGKYCVFFAARYAQGLLVVFLAACIPLDARQKQIAHWFVVIGGLIVALYAIPEYIRGGSTRYITDDKVFVSVPGSVLSCLGANYFHVATFSPMASVMTLALSGYVKNPIWRWPLFGLAFFIGWPALACGSRAGLIAELGVIAGALVCIKRMQSRALIVGLVTFVVVAVGISQLPSIESLAEKSLGLSRLIGLEKAGNQSIADRTGFSEDSILIFPFDKYSWQGWRLFVFGGGFYAVPRLEEGQLRYREGYGYHMIYWFCFEQTGIPGSILFIIFIFCSIKELANAAFLPEPEDRAFARGIGIFFVVLLVIGWAGQVFWQGFGTENYNSYIIFLLILATKPTSQKQPQTTALPGMIYR